MRLAETRVINWLPEAIMVHVDTNGFPERIVKEAEYVAALLLRRELYDNDATCRDDLREAQSTISCMTLDTRFEGRRDTGSSCEVNIVRSGRAISRTVWDQGRLRATNEIPLGRR